MACPEVVALWVSLNVEGVAIGTLFFVVDVNKAAMKKE